MQCLVCSADLSSLTEYDACIHINTCLDAQQQQQQQQSNVSSSSTSFPSSLSSSSVTCAVCGKNLEDLSNARRNAHVERCLNADVPQPAPEYACVVCGKDLSAASHRYRVDHLKACARNHGVAPSDIRHSIPNNLRFSGKGHTAVRSFLDRHNLSEYSDALLSAGFDSLDRITSLARPDDVRASILGIPSSPARRLSRAAKQLLHIRHQEKERAKQRRISQKRQKRRLKRVPRTEKQRFVQAVEASLQPTEFHAPPLLITSRRQSLDELASAAISKMFEPRNGQSGDDVLPRRRIRKDGLWEASALGAGLQNAHVMELAAHDTKEETVLTATDLKEKQRKEVWMPQYYNACREAISKAEKEISNIINNLQHEMQSSRERFGVPLDEAVELPDHLQHLQCCCNARRPNHTEERPTIVQSQESNHAEAEKEKEKEMCANDRDLDQNDFVIDISELEMLSPVSQESNDGEDAK